MKKLILFLMVILAVAGLASICFRFQEGMKLTNLTSYVPWGMWVVFYIYFVGLSAGAFLISTLSSVFGVKRLQNIGSLSLLMSLMSLLAGLTFIWIDLGHPLRFYKIFLNWNPTSVLAWEVLFYSVFMVILFISFWFLERCNLSNQAQTQKGLKQVLGRILSFGFKCPKTKQEFIACHGFSLKLVKILGILGIPVVLLVRGGTGALFAVVIARPHWFGGLLPVVFLVSGLVSATAMLLFIYPIFFSKKDEHGLSSMMAYLRNLLVLFLCIETLLLASETFVGIYSKIPERLQLYHNIMFGPFPYIFWIGQFLLGLVVPLIICTLKKTRANPSCLSVAGLSSSCGIVSVILNLVIPAYVLPLLKGLDTAFIDKRLMYSYFPSTIEWVSSFGLISLISLIFIFLAKNLPIQEEVAL